MTGFIDIVLGNILHPVVLAFVAGAVAVGGLVYTAANHLINLYEAGLKADSEMEYQKALNRYHQSLNEAEGTNQDFLNNMRCFNGIAQSLWQGTNFSPTPRTSGTPRGNKGPQQRNNTAPPPNNPPVTGRNNNILNPTLETYPN